MAKCDDLTLICPQNDLESAEILRIARDYLIDVRESPQLWGGTLAEEYRQTPDNLKNIKRRVAIVELPGKHEEVQLRREGHEVIIIDHHDYADLKRWKRASSIEQFCELIGHQMTEDEWNVAANDRDFISGLSRLGCSYEAMGTLRKRERIALKSDHLLEKAFAHIGKIHQSAITDGQPLGHFTYEGSDNRRHFKDLDIIIAPEKYTQVMAEVAQWPEREVYNRAVENGEAVELQPCLIIYHVEGHRDKITQVNYYGPTRFIPAFDDLIRDDTLSDFKMWCGGGAYSCFWGAKPKHINANTDELIDRVLSFTLIDGRPLRRFCTTFLFPFRYAWDTPPNLRDDYRVSEGLDESDEDYRTVPRDQEIVFFLPSVRRLFYQPIPVPKNNNGTRIGRVANSIINRLPCKNEKKPTDDAIAKWTLKPGESDLGKIRVTVSDSETQKLLNDIPIGVKEIALYRFFNDIHMLSISVNFKSKNGGGSEPFWERLIDSDLGDSPSLGDALIFNKLARLVYSAYRDPAGHGKSTTVEWLEGNDTDESSFELKPPTTNEKFEPELSPIIKEMIGRFSRRNEDYTFNCILDERMFVHTCFALAGPKPQHRIGMDRYNVVFSLATYVDEFNDGYKQAGGYAYDPDFVEKNLLPVTYKRWEGIDGNLYGFTRYSAVYVAFGGFFCDVITAHVRTMYLRMSLLGIFYRASVIDYACQVANANQPTNLRDDDINRYLDAIYAIHWEMVRFANKHWFHQLTNADQGIEIYDLQRKALGIQEGYNIARAEIERTYENLTSHYQSKLNTWARRVSVPMLFFAAVALLTSALSVNFSKELKWVEWYSESPVWFWFTMALTGVAIFFCIIYLLKTRKSSRDDSSNRKRFE